ncbi:hypothetical protein [Paenarthrobacter sp. PH39-S1]|uniref:hypothetical protein n=1 Tax=Paenarthrobacter sp. PH39-S1 TaxID=3046204 RepID=UPI0024B9A063|nr:hypothetical protein [Paenarthrobacter sp. PH39-S1]MDJ0358410.1 hypothetical protein [Paenarthrobacter sp. PH39-S1]
MKVVVAGEFILPDQATGEVTGATEGARRAVFPKEMTVKFETPQYGLGFFTGHRSFPTVKTGHAVLPPAAGTNLEPGFRSVILRVIRRHR